MADATSLSTQPFALAKAGSRIAASIAMMATTWNQASISNAPHWPPIKAIIPQWK